MEEMTPITSNESVATEVRAELGRKCMSQAELARRLRRTEMYVHRRLKGEVPFAVVELAAVAELLDVPVAQFLSGAA